MGIWTSGIRRSSLGDMREENIVKPRPMVYKKEQEIEVLARNSYKGYRYAVVSGGVFPYCYVSLPEGHPFTTCKDEYDIDIDVHGGVTFLDKVIDEIGLEGKCVGWDFAHPEDFAGYNLGGMNESGKKWTTEELVEQCEHAIDQIEIAENMKSAEAEL